MSLHSRRPRAAALRFRLLRADTKDYSGANENLTVTRIPRQTEAQVLDERPQTLAAAAGEESFATLGASTVTSGESVPLPTKRPTPDAKEDVDSNWIRPLAFVNLREGP